ncbi:MAG: TlyA family rRNA (cytidine-2'-O)-methyltransferase [Chloroflexi bacterium]|nr:TlyA family RNA methyltransferase [Chloroflexi bacterium CFX1]MCK6567331.1 TlyA family RNA methyltransferase [Anaerolineales bacterium]MCQ3953510.1 TlyA family rRNA (cytidine-2'-O)-methyltransferase [Chloroflexota bacterium]MDL1918920.1 TlyA family RNA methyltransferase [Chloroflexi bacterium CFX5]NUQ59701.1 TlyA family RNA methyltransferase [Anaerolineales bacterium]
MPKVRLDVLLVEKGLADSRAKAQALIMAGQVRIAGQVALKPATPVQPDSALTVDTGPRFVSRGGEKLEGALQAFKIDVTGFVCADVGASTGGFTDCLLQRGAAKVYAIDVGKGILHWKLRNDSRVVVMEEMNARFVESLPEKIDLATVDASFISLKVLLPVVRKWFTPLSGSPPTFYENGGRGRGAIVALIKPQFEAGKKEVSRGDGVIRDPEIHRRVLSDVLTFAKNEGFGLRGLAKSSLLGPKGNAEFLAWLDMNPNNVAVEDLVNHAVDREIASDGNTPSSQ